MTADNGQQTTGAMPPAHAPRRNRGWIWYIAVVLALTVVATTTLIVFNLRQQLKPEQLEAAWQRWREHGPKDYELRYTNKYGEEPHIDHYVVVVRGGKAVSITFNKTMQLPKERFPYYGMPALFDQIERDLKRDRQPGAPRAFMVAHFDPKDGHLLLYRRSVSATRERQEITVEEFKRLDGKEAAKGS